eukprot:767044-Hanusia_phi.AAC.3
MEVVQVNILPVNDPPSFVMNASLTVFQMDGIFSTQVVWDISAGPTDESNQTMTFELKLLTGSLNYFHILPTIDRQGVLTFARKPGTFGATNWSVILHDDGGNLNGGVSFSTKVIMLHLIGIPSPVFDIHYEQPRNGYVLITWNHSDFSLNNKQLGETFNLASSFLVTFRECKATCVLKVSVQIEKDECDFNCNVTMQIAIGVTYSVAIIAQNKAGQATPVLVSVFLPDLTPKLEYLSVSSADMTASTPCSVVISNFPRVDKSEYSIRVGDVQMLTVEDLYFVGATASTSSQVTLMFTIPPWNTSNLVNISVGLKAQPNVRLMFPFEYFSNTIPRISFVFPSSASTIGGDSVRITVANVFESNANLSSWLVRFGNISLSPVSYSKVSASDAALVVPVPGQSQFTSVTTIDVHLLYKQYTMSFALQIQPPCDYGVFCPATKSSYLANDYQIRYDPPISMSCNMKYCLDTSTFASMRLTSSSPSTGSTKGGSAVLISIASETLISAWSGGLKVLFNGLPLEITIVSTVRLTTINFTSPQFVSPCCCGRNYTCTAAFQVVDLFPTRSLSVPFEFLSDIEGPPNIVSIYPGCTAARSSSCAATPVLTLQRSSIMIDLDNFPKLESLQASQVAMDFNADPNATVQVLSSTNAFTRLNISFISPAAAGTYVGRVWAVGYQKSDSFQIYVQSPPVPQVLSYFPSKFVEGDSIQIQAQIGDWSHYFELKNVTAVSSTNLSHAADFLLVQGSTSGSATLRVSFLARLSSSSYQLRIEVRRVANQEIFNIPLSFEVSATPYIGYVFPSSGQVLSSTTVNVVLYNAFALASSQLFARFNDLTVDVTDASAQTAQNSSARVLSFSTPSIASIGSTQFCITSSRDQCGSLTSQFQFLPPVPSASRRASSRGGTNVSITFYGTNDGLKVYALLPSKLSGVVRSELKARRISTCSPPGYCFQEVSVEAPASLDGSDVLVQLNNGNLMPQSLAISYFLMPELTSISPKQSSVMGGDSVQVSLKNFPAISTAQDVSVFFGSQQARVQQVLGYNDFICVSPGHTTIEAVQLSIIPSRISHPQEKADMTVHSQYDYSRPTARVLSLIPSKGAIQGGAVVTMIVSHFPSTLTPTSLSVTFSGKQQASINRIIHSDSYSGESIVEVLMPALPQGLQQGTVTVFDGYNSTAAISFESYDASIQLTCNRLATANLENPIVVAGDCRGGVDGTDLLLLTVTNIRQVQGFSDLAITFGTEYAVSGKLINSTMQKTFVIVTVPPNNFYLQSTVIDLSVTNVKTISGTNSLQGREKFEYIAAPTMLSASFDALGSSITVSFSESTNIFSLQISQLSTCTTFLQIPPSQPFGKSAKCTWEDDQTLNIILSYDATVTVSDYVQLRTDLIRHVSGLGPFSTGYVQVEGPSVPIKPVFQLLGPQEVGPCDDAEMIALGTSSRPLTFYWTCLGCSDAIQSKLAVTMSDKVVLSSSDLAQEDSTYRIQVYGVNFLGARSDTLSLQFYRTSLPIPVVSLSGFDSYKKSDDIILGAQAAFSKCSQEIELQFKWEQINQEGSVATNNVIPSSALARSSPTFFLPKGTLAVPGLYKLKLTVTLPTIPPTQTAVSTSFTLLASDLIAIVKNGDSKIGRSQQLVLDGQASRDPDYMGNLPNSGLSFVWSCKVQDMLCRDRTTNNPFSFPTSPVLSMSSLGFDVDVPYVFTLEVSKDSRAASTSVSMLFVEEFVPLTALSSPSTLLVKGENVLNPLETLSLVEYSCASCTSYQWQLQDQGTSTILSGTTNELYLSSSNFVQGRRYTVTVTSFQPPGPGQVCNGVCKGSASFDFRVNRAPSGGQCVVQPTQGYELDTKFAVTCGSFSDSDLPLSFQFSYKVNNGTEASLAPSSSPMRSLYLSAGEVEISVIAIDSLGAQSVYLLHRVTVLPIASVAPNVAQQALDAFVLLGKTSEFSNYAISLTQKLSQDSVIARRRQSLLNLRQDVIQFSVSVLIRSNTTMSLLRIIEKQVPSSGNVLETIGTLTFLVNSSEPLTTEATLAAVQILSNTTLLVPQVLEFSLERTDVQAIIFIAASLKDQLQQSALSLAEKTRCFDLLAASTSIAIYHGTFDFIDTKNNLVCDGDCVAANSHILTYKWKSPFTKLLQPQDISVGPQFMNVNFSAGSSAVVSPSAEQSTLLYVYMYVWKNPFPTITDTFISDSHGFILGLSDQNGVKSSATSFAHVASIPVSQNDISRTVWNCVLWKQGWNSDLCTPVGFSPNVALCSCQETGLIAVSKSIGVCGDGRVTDQEECDDGNNENTDGCSETCSVERGFTCQAGNSVLPSKCVTSSSPPPACKPHMFGPQCEKLCLGELVDNNCTSQTLSALFSKTASVNGAVGGQVTLSSWGNLSLPQGFYDTQFPLSAKFYDGIPSASESFVGPALVLEPSGASFLKPLTLALSTSHIQDLVARPVALYYLNSNTSEWEYVESAVNADQNILTASLHHFSMYAVFRKLPDTPSPSPSGGSSPSSPAPAPPPLAAADSKSSRVSLIVGLTVSCGVVALTLSLLAYYRKKIISQAKAQSSDSQPVEAQPQVSPSESFVSLEPEEEEATRSQGAGTEEEAQGSQTSSRKSSLPDEVRPGHVAEMMEKQNQLAQGRDSPQSARRIAEPQPREESCAAVTRRKTASKDGDVSDAAEASSSPLVVTR